LLAELNRVPEALADYERAIKARPDFVDAWANRSYLLRRLHRYEEALECSERALKLDPKHPEAHNSRGATFADLGRYDEAMASYERAIELNPSSAEALWNKGLIELTRGELRKGWKHYESRWGVKTLKLTQRFPGIPPWQGESVNGKSILLHTEQGYGDMIQFSRFCSEIAALGARVIVSAPEALRSLFESLHGIHEVIGPTTVPAFDFHCPLMSAPLALGTELENIPAPVRYLHANSTAKAQWADRLRARKHSSAVGLVWSGRNTHSKDRERSIPLQQFLPLLRDTVQWVSLQKEIRASDEAYLVNTPAILRMGEELDDFADAAALVENLDLVITVDTAVAHLAGALGKPVWILLPYVADWRWLQNREDSPWYPTARLFRQSARRDWGEVIDRVGVELRKAHLPDASKDGKATRPSRARLRKK
jgi:Tetratricopeptide repeat/Glycosyltransferase family 9 (heptosyltransferase)